MDSDDDMPLILRHVPKEANGHGNVKPSGVATAVLEKPAAPPKPIVKAEPKEASKPTPVAKPAPPKPAAPVSKPAPPPKKPAPKDSDDDDEEDDDDDGGDEEEEDDEDDSDSDDDDKPLAKRIKTPVKKPASGSKRPATARASSRAPANKKTKKDSGPGKGEKKWDTFRHCGVLFPPEYEPHGVKMLYDGKPVELTPDQEEVATMFAVMKETDYMSKNTFLTNFWTGFKEVLGKKHTIQSLDKCDFTPMYDYHMSLREAKKEMTKEEKLRIKEEREQTEAKFKVAYVDGREEPVGNYRVEPPGLFRGRGEHPKMGMIKKRIYPRDITINIGKGEPIPEHPFPGQTWKEVKHDNTVTWLAYWKDTVSSKDYKYVFLGATSTFKADSDLAKYEKARKLKDLIDDIRKNYEADWNSPSMKKQQMGTALYFIDKLALRAGHEKDEDEADTVGCCTLKVDNVELVPPSSIKFDFLGKDSMRYENTVEVHPKVYKNMEKFKRMDGKGKKKSPGDELFDEFTATDLNQELKNIMDGLSVKVFRTYNASIVLDKLLTELGDIMKQTVDAKKVEYDKANKEVAILCNHQRSVPKAHGNQMEKLQEKVKGFQAELKELEDDLRLSKKGKEKDGKKLPDPSVLQVRIGRKQEQISKIELQISAKEDLKTVALGTSKINYMDPRITVAWCKRNEVPIEKVFNKSLLNKFLWAMDTDPDFHF